VSQIRIINGAGWKINLFSTYKDVEHYGITNCTVVITEISVRCIFLLEVFFIR